MNSFDYPAPNGNGAPSAHAHRHSLDSRSNAERMQAGGNGTMPMPMGTDQRGYGGVPGDMGGFGPMGMPRSPPKNKNTQHVPCKFFLLGQCQAGRTCPFSHDVESTTRPAPCKYFAKGHCKFGRKCALLHVTSEGHIVNRAQPFVAPGPGYSAAQPLGQPTAQARGFPQLPPPGLLSKGFEQRPGGEQVPPEFDNSQYGPRNGYEVPQIDTSYIPGSPQYGSPPQQDSRVVATSPGKGLSVLDAPLPSSFDSNGISMAARHGPLAQSVPTKFGIESPPSSLPHKAQLGNTAIRDLHKSAYGERGMDNVLAGSSPPSGPDEPLTFPKRSLHLARLSRPGNQMISASLGAGVPNRSFEYSDDEDDDEDRSDREEDLLPASIRDEISEGRMRRESRTRYDEENNTPASFLAAQRRTISGQATPSESKVGSPLSSSPSRYNNVFARSSRPADGDGLVGSPLRNSSFGGFATTTAAVPRPSHANGDLSPTVSSPPRQASMSMLTQELQRTKLDAARSQAAVGMTRTKSGGSTSGGGRSSLERAVSGQSVGRERIEEEQDLFDMEELGDGSFKGGSPRLMPNGSNRSRSGSGGGVYSGSPSGAGEPNFGAIGGHRTPK